MRIVQGVGWYLPDSLGGTEIYVAALARLLARRGHDVHVVAPDPGATVERHYEHDRIPVHRYPIPDAVSRDEARGLMATRGAERFHRWLHEWRPDVVHLHTFVTGLGPAEVAAARASGARVVVTTHSASLGLLCERGTLLRDGIHLCDARVGARTCAACALGARGLPSPVARVIAGAGDRLPAWLPAPGRLGTALALPRLVSERRIAHQRLLDDVDAFVVLSDFARDVLLANGAPPSRVSVNRLAVAPRPDGWPRKPDPVARSTTPPLVVGYLSRAEAIKGLDDLVHAVLALPADARVELRAVVIAGSGVERRHFEYLQRAAAHDARVTFLRSVSPRDVPQVLAGFDVLCCPSRVVEGGPTVALEAHAVGTPVIGSRLPALSEIVDPQRNGALYAAGDRAALAALLADLAVDPARVDRWRAQLPTPRTFDQVVDDYIALYTGVPVKVAP
jgi:glycosyltransferase involved in cell wall biosynthesis